MLSFTLREGETPVTSVTELVEVTSFIFYRYIGTSTGSVTDVLSKPEWTNNLFFVPLQDKRWDDLPRRGASAPGEESPDREGHPTEESSDGSNLMSP